MTSNHGRTPELDSRIKSDIESTIRSAKIFILSKIKCGACVQAKALLNKIASKAGFTPVVFDLDNYPTRMVKAIIKWLSAKTAIKTVPQIWIHGKFVGGNDDVQRLHWQGRLVTMITKKAPKGKVLEGRSFSTKNAAKPCGVSPSQVEVPRLSILKDYRSDSLSYRRSIETSISPSSYRSPTYTVSPSSYRSPTYTVDRKSIEASISPLSYRSSTYTVDDNKQDMTLQNSHSQKLILENSNFEQRARSFSYTGNTRRPTNMNGRRANLVLLSRESSGSSRPKETNVVDGNTSFAGIQNVQWATVQHPGRSKTNEKPKGVLVSRLV